MRVECARYGFGDAGNADVPADVPAQFALGQAEIAERGWQQPAVMIAGEQERRAAVRIEFEHRRNLRDAEE